MTQPSPTTPSGAHPSIPTVAFAVGHLRSVDFGPDVIEYLKRIDETLEPFGGRFLVHGGEAEVLEPPWDGDLVVIGFPDRDAARAWYRSAAYQAILPLRTENSDSSVILIDGVVGPHRATDVL